VFHLPHDRTQSNLISSPISSPISSHLTLQDAPRDSAHAQERTTGASRGSRSASCGTATRYPGRGGASSIMSSVSQCKRAVGQTRCMTGCDLDGNLRFYCSDTILRSCRQRLAPTPRSTSQAPHPYKSDPQPDNTTSRTASFSTRRTRSSAPRGTGTASCSGPGRSIP
jgi:hypothetical protein